VQRPELLRGALTSEEQAQIQSLPELAREEALLRLWCAKEAAAKVVGTGLGGSPERFEVAWSRTDPDLAIVRYDGVQLSVVVVRHGSQVLALANASVN
jgi:phosphopantetheinyl transferase